MPTPELSPEPSSEPRLTLPELRWARPGLSARDRERAVAMLSPQESARLPTERAPESFLQGRMLLRSLAAELTGLRPSAVPLTARCPDCGGPHGRPVAAGLFLSLARCEAAIVVVASSAGPIGVDVEPREGTPERLRAIDSVAGPGGIARWTSVEAVLKADGRGLRVDPREVIVAGDSATLGELRYRLWHPRLDSTVQVTVAQVTRHSSRYGSGGTAV